AFALLDRRTWLSGYAVQPHLSSPGNLAQFERTLPAMARSGTSRRCFQLLYTSATDAYARRHGGTIPRSQDRDRSPGQARSERSRSVGRFSQDVPAEAVQPGVGERFRAL